MKGLYKFKLNDKKGNYLFLKEQQQSQFLFLREKQRKQQQLERIQYRFIRVQNQSSKIYKKVDIESLQQTSHLMEFLFIDLFTFQFQPIINSYKTLQSSFTEQHTFKLLNNQMMEI
ncbi:unnamed protein product (macronuclear) [Paramecium tetraurelia]|uniref:Transmembrane protein n=1 Tax=Paramecium tetraurelia TaxID=5888 RepID=A0E7I4_PARTE|nr:uncharacterized protein GSPATT00023979001 [Paramecium tetraurelia]CAK91251.1 unnamed protein product [Paramecium tetraurelia]|eukprot:XP_001458648.1 hypothetical protein (macronuclear) [Paramecium tetraurelia strain d4-2]